jgi:hypothetical protein
MGCVEEVAIELEVVGEAGDEVGCAVESVADDRMAEGLGVDADLVSAASLDADLDEGEGTIGSGKTFESVEV